MSSIQNVNKTPKSYNHKVIITANEIVRSICDIPDENAKQNKINITWANNTSLQSPKTLLFPSRHRIKKKNSYPFPSWWSQASLRRIQKKMAEEALFLLVVRQESYWISGAVCWAGWHWLIRISMEGMLLTAVRFWSR